MVRPALCFLVIAIYCASGCMTTAEPSITPLINHVQNPEGEITDSDNEVAYTKETGVSGGPQEKVMHAMQITQEKSRSVSLLCGCVRKDASEATDFLNESQNVLGELGGDEINFTAPLTLGETAKTEAAAAVSECDAAEKLAFEARVKAEKIVCDILKMLREEPANSKASEHAAKTDLQLREAEKQYVEAQKQYEKALETEKKAKQAKEKASAARDIAQEISETAKKLLRKHKEMENELQAMKEKELKMGDKTDAAVQLGGNRKDQSGLTGNDSQEVNSQANDNKSKGKSSPNSSSLNCAWTRILSLLLAALYCLVWC